MLKPRQLMFGFPLGQETDPHVSDNPDDPYIEQADYLDVPRDVFQGVVVVPVFARPHVQDRGGFFIDRSAEIVVGDVPDWMSMSAFERTQAEIDGIDNRGTPTIDYDSVSTDT